MCALMISAGLLGIVRDAGAVEIPMLLLRHRVAGAGGEGAHAALDVLAQHVDHLDHARPAARAVQDAVEGLVQLEPARLVALRQRRVHLFKQCAHLLERRLVDSRRGPLDGAALQQQPHRIELLDLCCAQPRDLDAAIREERHEPFGRQLLQRLSHGHPADAEPLGQLVEVEPHPRRHLSADDRLSYGPRHRVGPRQG